MSESVGDQWGEYLRVGRRMSEHTVDAYLGDLRALLDYLGIGWDAPAGEFAHALTQRRIRSWLADTLVRGGARSTIARHTAAVRNFTAWAVREEILPSDPAAALSSPRRPVADARMGDPRTHIRVWVACLRGVRARRVIAQSRGTDCACPWQR